MNRQIKFRGLRTDGKGWVYGVPFYISGERKCFIIDNCQSAHLTQEDSVFDGKEVKYRSVGQFTGLHDKNGAEIYEGDIVRVTEQDEDSLSDLDYIGVVIYGNDYKSVGKKFVTDYPCSFTVYCKEWYHEEGLLGNRRHEYEVTGNIHEETKTK